MEESLQDIPPKKSSRIKNIVYWILAIILIGLLSFDSWYPQILEMMEKMTQNRELVGYDAQVQKCLKEEQARLGGEVVIGLEYGCAIDVAATFFEEDPDLAVALCMKYSLVQSEDEFLERVNKGACRLSISERLKPPREEEEKLEEDAEGVSKELIEDLKEKLEEDTDGTPEELIEESEQESSDSQNEEQKPNDTESKENDVKQETITSDKITVATESKEYRGAWFTVSYPENFTVHERENASTASPEFEKYDGVGFISPDQSVEFYVYSPLWSGTSDWEAVQANEQISSEKVEGVDIEELSYSGDPEAKAVKWVTIGDKKGQYSRSYQKTYENDGTVQWLLGIKYKTWADYEKYKEQYLTFKNSLAQYSD